MRKTICRFSGLAALLLLCGSGRAQAEPATPVDDTRAYFEVLRSAFNTDKVLLYNGILELTESEAERFWPIYRAYEGELAALADRKLEMIRDFYTRQVSGGLSEESAAELAKAWLKNAQGRLDLWRKYHRKISKAVSPVRAAQFLQVENQIAVFMDLAIASEMPEITPVAESGSAQ